MSRTLEYWRKNPEHTDNSKRATSKLYKLHSAIHEYATDQTNRQQKDRTEKQKQQRASKKAKQA
jgi:hypothetical protein